MVGALAVVVLGWLLISFLAAGATRSMLSWIATSALYVFLVSLFLSLTLEAWADGKNAVVFAFGFLCVLFGSGLLVSLAKTVGQIRTGASSSSDVIH